MRTTRYENSVTYIGAGLAFIAFLIVGAVPGLLYGGYLGLTMSNAILGEDAAGTLLGRCMTGGGMALGLVAALALFLVVGAVFGGAVGVLLELAAGSAHTEPEKAATTEHEPIA